MNVADYYAQEANRGTGIAPRVEIAGEILARQTVCASRLLDVGCGAAEQTLFLGRRLKARSLYGLEISETALAKAREKGIQAYAIDLNRELFPFGDASIDVVFCGELIEHLFDTDHLLDEIRRVLVPGGCCVLTTPNLASWQNRIVLGLGFQPFLSQVSLHHGAGRLPGTKGEGGGHLRMFTLRALRELTELHGFDVVEIRGVGAFDMDITPPPAPRGVGWLLRAVDGVLSRIPDLACGVALCARKRG
jgi:SAM-dependent methyltransferase